MNKVKNSTALAPAMLLAVAIPGTALADVTALEVWDSFRGYAESFGQTVTVGTQDSSGGTLTLRDVRLATEMPDGTMSMTIDMLEFAERSDGTVAVTMSPAVPMSVSANPPAGDEVDIALMLRHTGLTIVASGSDGTIAYDYLAPLMGISFDKFMVAGEEVAPGLMVNMSDLNGQYQITDGDLRQISSRSTVGTLDLNMDFVDPETEARVQMTASVADVVSQSQGSLPKMLDMQDPAAIFSSGLAVTGGLTAGSSTISMNVEEPGQSFSLTGGSASSGFDFALQDGGISYGATGTGIAYTVSGSQIPFPELNFGIDSTAFNFAMPMTMTDEARDFRLRMNMSGLSVDDMIWSMFDPMGSLPHDNATVGFDARGKMKWLIELTDAEAMAASESMDETPAELYELNISDLVLSMVGASVTGDGAFTFDNSDTTTFDGMPAPTGTLNLKIDGANGLLDKLIAMGLLPQEQAMGARMMLGLFARPGEGPDNLVSTIEVKGDGSVLANGQQIR